MIVFAGEPSEAGQIVAASGIVVSLGLAARVYSARGAGLLLAVCLVITFAVENVGVKTGYPFGHYHFNVGACGPHVGAVPAIVGPLYSA